MKSGVSKGPLKTPPVGAARAGSRGRKRKVDDAGGAEGRWQRGAGERGESGVSPGGLSHGVLHGESKAREQGRQANTLLQAQHGGGGAGAGGGLSQGRGGSAARNPMAMTFLVDATHERNHSPPAPPLAGNSEGSGSKASPASIASVGASVGSWNGSWPARAGNSPNARMGGSGGGGGGGGGSGGGSGSSPALWRSVQGGDKGGDKGGFPPMKRVHAKGDYNHNPGIVVTNTAEAGGKVAQAGGKVVGSPGVATAATQQGFALALAHPDAQDPGMLYTHTHTHTRIQARILCIYVDI